MKYQRKKMVKIHHFLGEATFCAASQNVRAQRSKKSQRDFFDKLSTAADQLDPQPYFTYAVFYLTIQRQRKVTTCALVQFSSGLKVVSLVPLVTSLSFAHLTAAAK